MHLIVHCQNGRESVSKNTRLHTLEQIAPFFHHEYLRNNAFGLLYRWSRNKKLTSGNPSFAIVSIFDMCILNSSTVRANSSENLTNLFYEPLSLFPYLHAA
ncbi:MAG: hypothetical protein RIB15_09430 [Gracilimonas sp.]|uniref:hypothetical protein n=1 Tax=Gracilimonas sp. TaxID=1974203 RepID=UPI0032EE3821